MINRSYMNKARILKQKIDRDMQHTPLKFTITKSMLKAQKKWVLLIVRFIKLCDENEQLNFVMIIDV